MSDYPTPVDAAVNVVATELTPTFAAAVLDKENTMVRLLGVDSEDRAVFYATDDGHLLRYEYLAESDELEMENREFIGRSLDENDAEHAFTWLTEFRGENLRWTHPRYRWLAEELDELTREPTA